jgi:ABC-2 type transport system permease protein
MFRSVFLKTLHDQRRGLIGWSIGLGLLVFIEAAVWPSMRDLEGMSDLYASFPDELQKLFNLEAMTTGTGFMNGELFTLLLPILFIVYAVGRGARFVAGEEEQGTLDLLLVTPLSSARLVLEKALALVAGVAVLGVVLLVVTCVSSRVFGLEISVTDAATGALSMVLLGSEFGAIALAAGTLTGSRATAIAVASVAATAAYVLYATGLIIDAVEPWRPWSPFDQALTGGPLGAGLPASYLLLAAGAAVSVLVALPVLDRRDIAARV